MKNRKSIKKGFTLIELLVVVLIIGILAAIALPQYQKAVEKARLSEVLSNIKVLKNNFSVFLLENGGYPSETTCFTEMGEAGELAGGTWENCTYTTSHFLYYSPQCSPTSCTVEISRAPNYDYSIVLDDKNGDACFSQETDLGRYICKSLEKQGFQYVDGGY